MNEIKGLNVVVLNGSPKGKHSNTVQYVKFIEKKFPENSYRYLNISQQIKKIEKDEKHFGEITDAIDRADLIIWSYPVYFMLVPAQQKRFIELVFERKKDHVFKGKYVANIATSIKFFDHTALEYMNGICDDLDMRYLGSYSAKMYDLFYEHEREKLYDFATIAFDNTRNRTSQAKRYFPVKKIDFDFELSSGGKKTDVGNKNILLIRDGQEENANLDKMVKKIQDCYSNKIKTVNLDQLNIKGSCLGCIQCGYDNTCVYEGKDQFIDFFLNDVKTADIIIFAGKTKDRYLSATWKTFWDRSFFAGHIPTLKGKQFGLLVSGPLRELPVLHDVFYSLAQNHKANFAGFVSDESNDSEILSSDLECFCEKLVDYSNRGYVAPVTFLGYGGQKIFRDFVWGSKRFIFQADHRYYRSNKAYDFPQKRIKAILFNLMMILLTKIPPFRKKLFKEMLIPEGAKAFEKLLDRV